MKKRKILFAFLLFIVLAKSIQAQKWNEKEVSVNQPSASVSLSMAYRMYATAGGQAFTCKVKNLTNSKVNVSFDLIAYTLCGNTVSKHIEMDLDPAEGNGNGSALQDDYAGLVKSSDCAGTKFRYHSQDLNMDVDGTNRISTLGYQNFVVKIFPPQSTSPKGKSATRATGANDKPTENSNADNPQEQQAGNSSQTGAIKSAGSMAATPIYTLPAGSLKTAQDKSAALDNAIKSLGDLWINSMNKKMDNELARMHQFNELINLYRDPPSQQRLESWANNPVTDKDSIVNYAMDALNYKVGYSYNSFTPVMLSRKRSKDDIKVYGAFTSQTVDYFPRTSSFDKDFSFTNLPAELPDLALLPLCHCFTEPKYSRPIDSAFYYLRDSKKCKKIRFQGSAYSVKTNMALPDHIDEEKALRLLKAAVLTPNVHTATDALDYNHAWIWILYLDHKKAKTVDDLKVGVKTAENYQNADVSAIEGSMRMFDQYYFEAQHAMIEYFLALYDYRLWNSDIPAIQKAYIPSLLKRRAQ